MRILVHDYAGHPFQLNLSEQLALSGHEVFHLHFAGLQTPKADFDRSHSGNLTTRGVRTAKPLDKSALLRRFLAEREYGHAIAEQIRSFRPEVVLSANTPIGVQSSIIKASRDVSARFYFWMQDFYSLALRRLLPKKLPVIGHAIGRFYESLEKRQLKRSDGVVFVTSDFLDIASDWGLRPTRCHVIENWAPLNEIAPGRQFNGWSHRNGLANKRVLLYSGTLGMKHNPEILWRLAERTQEVPDVVVAVVSSSPGAAYLRQRQRDVPLPNLRIFDTQPFGELTNVLATAEVLLSILEPSAGVFSVPSKVLSYLCAARPILCAMPESNLASRIVTESGAGVVIDPSDVNAFGTAALDLLAHSHIRETMGRAARLYAETAFDTRAISAQFERVFEGAPSIWHTHKQRTVVFSAYGEQELKNERAMAARAGRV